MSFTNTFVQVAADCPATRGEIPVARGEKKSIALIEYELLEAHPYKFTQNELIFEVYIRHKAIPEGEALLKRDSIWAELFKKPHPCMRASMLAKRYGWGVHYDGQGRIAIWPIESKEYTGFIKGKRSSIQVVPAMRNKRAQ